VTFRAEEMVSAAGDAIGRPLASRSLHGLGFDCNAEAFAANGQKLWGEDLGGAIAGGVITYTTNNVQKVAVASGFTMLAWPTKIVSAKIEILGLDSAPAN
jgi:hypothetical protein